jgi:hypothetical protein
MATIGTLLPRANAAACPQLAKADFASSSQHVREGQRIVELEAEIDALQRQALALGAEPTAAAADVFDDYGAEQRFGLLHPWPQLADLDLIAEISGELA